MRPIFILPAVVVLLSGLAGAILWRADAPEPPPAALPVPPFPPRIAAGEIYEQCLAMLADDPDNGRQIADAWAASGGGDGAAHCQGLALIATGAPIAGAERLERLALSSLAPDQARAVVFAQAAHARLMGEQPDRAFDNVTRALALTPGNTELLIQRAEISATRERWDAAINDLSQTLALDARRADALVLRAIAWRRMNRLDMAMADADRALALDPSNADALLEHGIERQRLGDPAGARADWQRARLMAPNSTTADLAEQNLALLEAGPDQR